MTYEERVKRFDAFIRLRKKGATQREIGEMYGITYQGVQSLLRRGRPTEHAGQRLSVLWKYGVGELEGRERARMLVRIRDNFTCKDCGKIRTLNEVRKSNASIKGLKGRMKLFDIHHIDGRCGKNSKGYDSTSDLSGMITLCHKCHYNRPEHTDRINHGPVLGDVMKRHKAFMNAKGFGRITSSI